MIDKYGKEMGHNLYFLSNWGVLRWSPLEADGDNYFPDLMYVRQWDHLNFTDVRSTWH